MNNDSINKQELNEEEMDMVTGGASWQIYHESIESKPGSFSYSGGSFTFKTREQAEQMFAKMDQKRPGYYKMREIEK